jgi:hypothetical protein
MRPSEDEAIEMVANGTCGTVGPSTACIVHQIAAHVLYRRVRQLNSEIEEMRRLFRHRTQPAGEPDD